MPEVGLHGGQQRRVATGRVALDLSELPDDTWTACPYVAGALPPGGELPPLAPGVPPEALGALLAREQHLGEPVGAIVATELGAENTADAMSAAAALGRPLLDADPAGRAVPELSHSTYHLVGLPIAPLALSTRQGDTLVVPHVASEQRAEDLVRAVSAASGHSVGVADHPLRGRDLRARGALIPGTISAAGRLGRTCREARESGASGEELADVIAAHAGGHVAFRGVVTDYGCALAGGFSRGKVVLRDDAGSRYAIDVQNEFILARRDGAFDACVPDLIVLVDESGLPALNPDVEVGRRHSVLVLPAPAPWRTARGLELLGPRSFGYDLDWQGATAPSASSASSASLMTSMSPANSAPSAPTA